MRTWNPDQAILLSVVVPCYNEEPTPVSCVEKVLEIEDESLKLECIIVNDCSTDKDPRMGKSLATAVGLS